MGFALAGAAVIAGVGYMSSQNAASAQERSSAEAMRIQQQIYNQQRADNEPFRQAGIGALDELKTGSFMNNWQANDPGYQFRMKEGQKALEAAAAARGHSNSGRTLKELTRYGQDYSSNEYGNAYNRNMQRLNSLLGIGGNANSMNNQNTSNYGNNASNIITNQGNSQAAGHIASGNAINSGIGQGMNQWQSYQMMNRLFGNPNVPSTNGYGSAGQSYNNYGSIA